MANLVQRAHQRIQKNCFYLGSIEQISSFTSIEIYIFSLGFIDWVLKRILHLLHDVVGYAMHLRSASERVGILDDFYFWFSYLFYHIFTLLTNWIF